MFSSKITYIFLLFSYFTLAQSLNIISRSEWGARPPVWESPNQVIKPASFVTIHHGRSSSCYDKSSCISKVRSYQDEHIDGKGWSDISYSFVVGEDGNVYEGRGWDKYEVRPIPSSGKTLGICVIGTFNDGAPNDKALNAIKELISTGVNNGKIASNYRLIGHRQFESTECPGDALFKIIQGWPHWSPYPLQNAH